MDYDTKYTVCVQGVEFMLNKSQIEFDSPNYFTACFLGEFQQSQTRRIELYRDPDLFRVVVEYLCGYQVLPLKKEAIPATMSPDSALLNLRRDAAVYQLDSLVKACDELTQLKKNSIKQPYVVLGAKNYIKEYDDDIDYDYSYDALHGFPTRPDWQTYLNEARLTKPPFNELQTPQSVVGTDGIRTTALIKKFASGWVKDPSKWRVVGWYVKDYSSQGCKTWDLLVVLEDLN